MSGYSAFCSAGAVATSLAALAAAFLAGTFLAVVFLAGDFFAGLDNAFFLDWALALLPEVEEPIRFALILLRFTRQVQLQAR